MTMPRAMPLGTTVALCTGSAPSVNDATIACPPCKQSVCACVKYIIFT